MDISKNKLGVYTDCLLILALLILSAVVSFAYMSDFTKKGFKPHFYQNMFSPAVLDVCGMGFKMPILKEGSLLKEFLDLKKDSFSCEDLHQEDLVARVGLNPFTGQTQYLMKLVALTWSVRGISWSALAPLYSLFFSLNIGLLYFLFRLGMGRWVAFAGSALLSISWVHLTYLPHLRDYSKATFLLALILILGCLVKWGNRRGSIVALAAGFGAVTGVGLGFRQDILICIPPFIVTLFFLLPCGARSNIRAKLEGLVLSSLLIFLVGWGPLSSLEQANNGWHVILMGFAPSFTEALGLKESIYQWIARYDDHLVRSMVSIYSYHKDSVYAFISTSQYDKITAAYFFEFVKLFPADLLTRVLASMANILNLSFVAPADQPLVNQSALEIIYRGRQTLMAPFVGWGLWPVVMALLVQSAYKMRFAIFSVLFLFYFCAAQTLQFHARHYFYLEFVFWWGLGFLLHHGWLRARESIRAVNLARAGKVTRNEIIRPRERWLTTLSRPLKFSGIILLITLGSLYGLREYQEGRLKEIFSAYDKAELVPLNWRAISQTNNSYLVEAQDFAGENSLWPEQSGVSYGFQYLVAEFLPRCESARKSGAVSPTFILGRENGRMDFAKNLTVIVPAKATGPTRVYYPVHSSRDARGLHTFKGLELSARDKACLSKIYKVKEPLSLSPVTLILTLPQDWETRPLYLSLN